MLSKTRILNINIINSNYVTQIKKIKQFSFQDNDFKYKSNYVFSTDESNYVIQIRKAN